MATFLFVLGLLLCLVAVGLIAFGLKFLCIVVATLAVALMLVGYGRSVQTEGEVYS